jgi:hypothetical protein
MKVIYRISESGYPKDKPSYITNKDCFINAYQKLDSLDFIVIADNITDHTREFLTSFTDNIIDVNIGSGAGTFNLALDLALKEADDQIIYFVENDYIHRNGSREAIDDIFNSDLLFDYCTLYDHPDKYLNPYEGGNPFCLGKSEQTRVFLTNTSHWKYTNSTTMTFMARVSTLKQDEAILRKWTSETHPHDFNMFIELGQKGRKIISPIPGFATHGETQWLSPLINWKEQL